MVEIQYKKNHSMYQDMGIGAICTCDDAEVFRDAAEVTVEAFGDAAKIFGTQEKRPDGEADNPGNGAVNSGTRKSTMVRKRTDKGILVPVTTSGSRSLFASVKPRRRERIRWEDDPGEID